MKLPYIAFTKDSGHFFTPTLNYIGTTGVIAVGGYIVGAISYFALKILGFSQSAAILATAVPTNRALSKYFY